MKENFPFKKRTNLRIYTFVKVSIDWSWLSFDRYNLMHLVTNNYSILKFTMHLQMHTTKLVVWLCKIFRMFALLALLTLGKKEYWQFSICYSPSSFSCSTYRLTSRRYNVHKSSHFIVTWGFYVYESLKIYEK